jgi:hypothetical protein
MERLLKEILMDQSSDCALVIGNGVIRAMERVGKSWEDIIEKISASRGMDFKLDDGSRHRLNHTEIFSALEMSSRAYKTARKEFSECIEQMEDEISHERDAPHRVVCEWASKNRAVVMTTNFDRVMQRIIGAKQKQHWGKWRSPQYPWSTYYSLEKTDSPLSGVSIWNIHGILDYKDSMRLGLSDYMGAVSRARKYFEESGFFRSRDDRRAAGSKQWKSTQTWLDLFFGRDLVFVGLALDSQEVFLRWLLIQREIYFRRNKKARRQTWYIAPREELGGLYEAKYNFLKSIGVVVVEGPSYKILYTREIWGV